MEKLLYGIFSFLVFIVVIFVVPLTLNIIESRQEKRKELEQDMKEQENWYKTVKR